MATSTTKTNKPLNPRGQDQSPKGYNRAELYTGKALDFDGVNDSIDISNFSLNGYTAFSICFYKTSGFPQNRPIFSSADNVSDGVNIYQVSPGLFRARLNGANIDTDSVVSTTDGFFVFTYDGSDCVWYQDGQSIGTGTTSQNLNIANTTSTIGRYSYSTSTYLDGQIANFKIFNTALTAAQVADLYNNPEKIVPTGVSNDALKLWLPMQEGAGTTAYDGSGNGNHGTISGATYTHGIGAPVSQTAVIDWNKGTNKLQYHSWGSGYTANNSSISTSTASSPDGVETAFIFDDGTLNTYHRAYKLTSCAAGEVTASTFVKKKDVDYINVVLGVDGGNGKRFALVDLVNGTIITTSGSPTATSIKSVGDGWYYVSVQETHASGNAIIYMYGQDPTNGSSIDDSYTGANNQTYIWGASVKEGAINNVFVPTYGSVQNSDVLLPQGLTTGRDITGVNLFENVRKQGALNLDGNSWAGVHDNASLDITDAITLEAWVYWDAGTDKGIFGRWQTSGNKRSYLLYKLNDNNASFYISSDGTSANQDFVPFNVVISEGWQHIIGVYDGSNLKSYLNGGLTNSVATSLTEIDANEEEIEIGRYQKSLGNCLNKPIAQPRIYNRALTAEEVERNYNAGKNTYTN